MVIHEFTCDSCEMTISDTSTIEVHACPICGGEMRWLINARIHGNYEHPVHSDALAVHPSQRAEHEQTFPNIRLDKQNRPIFENFRDHENYLKKCNLVKLPKKIKPKSNS